MSRNGPALSVQGLTKRFGDRVAFEDVSFEIGYGEIFGFLGPNGAGKTTTVRTLGTLIQPSSGSATVAGIPLSPENGVEIRRRIAVMPETPGLYPRLTLAENLECFADLYETPRPKDRVARSLGSVGLTGRADDLCSTLSKGLRQRMALARALLSDPEVLFLDEPTSGLDPAASHDVHSLISELGRSGVTIFLTTHRLEEAERLCDRVGILNTTLRTEPVLTTPIRREELLIGKALAVLLPSVALSYMVFAIFVACVVLFASQGIGAALLRGPLLLAQVVFTPLIAAWSIWIGMAISTRTNDVRTAQQFSLLASLPSIAVSSYLAFSGFPTTLALALALGAVLLILDVVGWRAISAIFDRERLITGTG